MAISDNSLVSVIMPAYNSAEFISRSILSVQAQTWDNWELLIVDDASIDATALIVTKAQSRDSRITLIRHEANCGVARSRQSAIKRAKGRYIAFLDSDDLWLPNKIQRQLDFMGQCGAAVSYTSYKKIDEHGAIISKAINVPSYVEYRGLLLSNCIANLTAMYDTFCIGKVCPPDIKHEDYAMWLNILHEGHCAYGLNECLALYRVHRKSVSANKLRAATYTWNIYRNFIKMPIHKSLYHFAAYAFHGLKKMLM